ncbi:hypothetical protein MJI69_30135, partial [Salmonella enterica subsp. enterica serovar Anatum]|nr:hypothetical protein [Salmonella enterica subsp. enterica serovar Anatum]
MARVNDKTCFINMATGGFGTRITTETPEKLKAALGVRARPHQLEAIVEKHQPDVIGLQETKVHDKMFPLEEVAKLGY